MSIVNKLVPQNTYSVKESSYMAVINWIMPSTGKPTQYMKFKIGNELTDISNSKYNNKVFIFIVNRKLTSVLPVYFLSSELLPVNSDHIRPEYIKIIDSKVLEEGLVEWAHMLGPETYHYLLGQNNYTICAFSNNSNHYATSTDIVELKRNLLIKVTGVPAKKDINTSDMKFFNGFFRNAGYYKDRTLLDDSSYIAVKGDQCIIEPCNASDMNNRMKNYTNLTILQLKSTGDNNVHYTIIDNFEYDGSSGGGDGYWGDSSSGGYLDTPTVQTNNYVTFKDSGQSIAKLNYIQNFNNYKLTFVPCKDNRTTTDGEIYPNNISLKLQTYSGTKKDKDGLSYYETKDNTLYAVIPPERIPNTARIVDTIEPLSRDFTVQIEKEELFHTLDKFFHYGTGAYLWSEDGTKLPGTGTNLEGQEISLKRDGYKYCNNRIPKMCCVITKYSKNINDKNGKDLLKELLVDNITFSEYITLPTIERSYYNFIYFDLALDKETVHDLEDDNIIVTLSENSSLSTFLDTINPALQTCSYRDYSVKMSISQERGKLNLYSCELFEAFTRGHDFIQEEYTSVRPQEMIENDLGDKKRMMEFDENYFTYKYTGREFDIFQRKDKNQIFQLDGTYCALVHEKDLLLETDVTLGDSYGCQEYFIEAIKYPEIINNKKTNNYLYKDTFKITDFVKAIDDTKYVEEDLEILTGKIDLLQCQYYDATKANVSNGWCDCCYHQDSTNKNYDKECMYQKLGICPYRFTAEKHPRKLRTLEQSKSNRFNLIQETSKMFEVYPYFYIEFDKRGKVCLDENNRMKKHVFFITEKGIEQQVGFRYEKNLSNISRTIDSTQITTKLFVQNVDSELSNTGLCSIQTAPDNLGKNSYIMDFSYYTQKNLLNAEQVQRDIYGIEKGDMAFLPTIDQYNKLYDQYSNLIINLTGQDMSELKAKIDVSVTGVSTALEERKKISQRMYQFKVNSYNNQNKYKLNTDEETIITSDTYKNYVLKFREQAIILWGLIEDLFFSGNYFTYYINGVGYNINLDNLDYFDEQKLLPSFINGLKNEDLQKAKNKYCKGELFWRLMLEGFPEYDYAPPYNSWSNFKEKVIDTNIYEINGWLGKYQTMTEQIKYWKTERAKILNKINDISSQFYKKYEPFIKEGTWTDSNFLIDNDYYWAAVSVLDDSCKPKISYNISVMDISPLEEYADDYRFQLADTTYIEDIDFFDINKKTGLPNRQKVMITEITYSLDEPKENSIKVQNYSSSFEDLFGSIMASVQSLTYNENTYKRASNFTAKQYIQTGSLQGTLNEGNLTLINSNNENIVLDDSGTQGNGITNASSEYKLSGEGLFFSTDGGETWDQGVGPQGINADYIKFGQLDASKIQIIDGEYIYFLWDKSGINAYRSPSASTNGLVDFARFNKYGLSLIENNHVRLRAGYEFKTSINEANQTGNYFDELPLTNQNVGFYLYNDSGQPIFKTETRSEYKNTGEDYSARLSLKGEIFATNANLDEENSGDVMDAVYGKKLSVGYLIEKSQMTTLTQNPYADGAQNYENWFFIDNINLKTYSELTVEPSIIEDSEKYIYIYNFILGKNVSKESIIKDIGLCLFRQEGNVTTLIEQTVLTSEQVIYNINIRYELDNPKPDDQKNITFNIEENWAEYIETEYYPEDGFLSSTSYGLNTESIKISDECYAITNDIVSIASKINYQAESVVLPQDFETEELNFLIQDTNDLTKYEYQKMTLIKYYEKVDDIYYNYWAGVSDSNTIIPTASTDIKTKEVGIFINNKVSLKQDDDNTSEILDTTQDETITEQSQTKIASFKNVTANPFDLPTGEFWYCGDSITEALMSQLKGPFIGVGSMGLWNYGTHFTYSSEQLNKIRKADSLAFNFGYNNLPMTKDNLIESYPSTLLKILGDNAKVKNIYFVSIKWTQERPTDVSKGVTAESAQEFNSLLSSVYNTNEFRDNLGPYKNCNLYYVDIWENTRDAAQGMTTIHGNNSQLLYNGIYKSFSAITGGGGGSGAPTEEEQRNPSVVVTEEMRNVQRGSERMFTIAMTGLEGGNKVFKNILSVLKNGALYIGGEITGEYGQELNLSNLSYLPDRIRINDPGIILGNNGSIWCHWDRFFQIDEVGNLTDRSLENALKSLGDAISSGGDSEFEQLKPGYYLIDPIK